MSITDRLQDVAIAIEQYVQDCDITQNFNHCDHLTGELEKWLEQLREVQSSL